MPTTQLPDAERFFQPELSKVFFADTLADPKAVTRPELNAAVDISDQIAALSGWTVSGNMIPTPDYGARFTSSIAGRTTVENSSITFYGDVKGNDARNLFPRKTRGYIIFADGGDEPGSPADIFPIEVMSVGKLRSVDDQAYQLTISYAITDEPAEDVPIPAVTP